jgi:hypothetical protein
MRGAKMRIYLDPKCTHQNTEKVKGFLGDDIKMCPNCGYQFEPEVSVAFGRLKEAILIELFDIKPK